jgi:hypothetical protein
MPAHTLTLALTLAVLSAGCTPMPPAGADAAGDEWPFATGRSEYRAAQHAGEWAVDIDFTFINTTERTLYVPVCRQPHPPALEKLEGTAWVPAYSPAVLLCWEAPLEIAPGGAFTDTLHVRAGVAGGDVHPQLEVDEIAGTYRLVWSVLRSNQAGGARERLTSDTFTIRRAEVTRTREPVPHTATFARAGAG